MHHTFKQINKTLNRIILLGNVLRLPALARVVFLLSCKLCLKEKKSKIEGEEEVRKRLLQPTASCLQIIFQRCSIEYQLPVIRSPARYYLEWKALEVRAIPQRSHTF